jgi:hypothetical protein
MKRRASSLEQIKKSRSRSQGHCRRGVRRLDAAFDGVARRAARIGRNGLSQIIFAPSEPFGGHSFLCTAGAKPAAGAETRRYVAAEFSRSCNFDS